jgi:hypothetical protein
MRHFVTSVNKERFASGLLLLAVAFAACLIPAQSDTWWQLRAGEEMWRTGRVMLHDEFTHTVAGGRWPNHEWLTQVIFYGAYALGGMPLLTLLCAAAITAAWTFAAWLTPGPPLVRAALVGLAAMASSPGWSLRPQALTLGLCGLTIWILVRRRALWILPPAFLIWANLHGAVALGGVLVFSAWVAAAILDRERLRTLTVIGALCLAATAATPLGLSLWLEIPESLARLRAYGVSEWRSPELSNVDHVMFWLTGAAFFAVAAVRRQRLRSADVLTLAIAAALLFVLGTRSERNIPPFLVCAAPAIAALLHGGTARRAARQEPERRLRLNAAALATLGAAGMVFIASAWRAPLPRLQWAPLSDSVAAAIASCPGRLYNRYDEGGYLIWFMKDRKVFIDNRQDPFPPEMVLEHIEVERSGDYRAMFDRYDIGCSLTLADSPLGRRLKQDGWHELDANEVWKVYRRPDNLAIGERLTHEFGALASW